MIEKPQKNTQQATAIDMRAICQKEVLTAKECALYVGISQSTLYKWMFNKQIPYFKPCGKLAFFNRVEVENWLQSNRCASHEEINQRAEKYLQNKKMGGEK